MLMCFYLDAVAWAVQQHCHGELIVNNMDFSGRNRDKQFFFFLSFLLIQPWKQLCHINHYQQEITTDSVRTWKTVCITFLKTFIHSAEDALIEAHCQ